MDAAGQAAKITVKSVTPLLTSPHARTLPLYAQSVLQVMRKLRDGDMIVYADGGCSIHGENWQRFWQYVQLVRAAPHPQVLGFKV